MIIIAGIYVADGLDLLVCVPADPTLRDVVWGWRVELWTFAVRVGFPLVFIPFLILSHL